LLADGVSDPGVDDGWLQGDGTVWPLAQGVKGRVGLLRGFGNAIVPELAAEFIIACDQALKSDLDQP
jgi:DNA (cytosine-5)-methyltransferase 1